MNGSLKARIQSECFFANQMNERPCLKQTPSWPQFFLFLLLEHFPPLFSTLPHRLICSTRLRCFILFIVDSMHNRRFKSSIYQLPEFHSSRISAAISKFVVKDKTTFNIFHNIPRILTVNFQYETFFTFVKLHFYLHF